MTTFTTPKGTILTIDMLPQWKKDKKTQAWIEMPPAPYLKVPYRIQWFREEHPDWSIETQKLEGNSDFTIFKAVIKDNTGRIMSMAHKSETSQDFGDHLEKAETSAIGRALALCGYGTTLAIQDLDEGDRLADAPAAPKYNGPLAASIKRQTGEINCDACGGPLYQKPQTGNWYCKNWKDKSKGDHTFMNDDIYQGALRVMKSGETQEPAFPDDDQPPF